jgi:hypothetical protein
MRALRGHAVFGVVLLAGTALRVAAMIGYRGALWFPDSRSYVRYAVHLEPSVARPQGYAFFLRALEPFHDLGAVVAVQHLMGLAVGVGVYAVARRYGLPGWGAALAAAPVLLDAYEIQLEHVLLSDTLFLFLVAAAVLVLLWRPRSAGAAVVAGLLVGAATVTRSVGLPLLAVVVAYLLVRWWRGAYGPRARGWRPIVAVGLAGAVPVVAYGMWFQATWGSFELTRSGGVFLYSRTTTFVDCARVRMPAPESALCPAEPLGARYPAPSYIWHEGALGRLPGGYDAKFTPANSRTAAAFARRAILGQPGAYLGASLTDLGRTFAWTRTDYPRAYDTAHYEFPDAAQVTYPGASGGPLVALSAGRGTRNAVAAYAHGDGRPVVVEPAAGFLRAYQAVAYVRGPMFAVLLLGAPLMALVRRVRRRGVRGEARGGWALAWVVGAVLVAVPPFTAAFDYRYVLPAVPLVCVGLAVACGRRAVVAEEPVDVPEVAASEVADAPVEESAAPVA